MVCAECGDELEAGDIYWTVKDNYFMNYFDDPDTGQLIEQLKESNHHENE